MAIALIDGNNFYASCEQSLDPSLAGRPLVILSNNDGCIVARSAEARKLRIRMGQPYFKIRHELERLGVIVRSSNYALYGDMSQRLMNLLESNCEQLEIYSIDEAFASLTHPLDYDPGPWARQLRALVHQNIGIPISIGIGANKSQAKLANRLAKTVATNAGIFDLLMAKEPDSWLEAIPIESVWGIGRKLAHWCRMKGVTTALQLRDMPSNQLRAKCGIAGVRLQRELRGENCLPLAITLKPKRETCVSRSFSQPITSLGELRQAIATHIVHAAKKLRAQSQRAGAITVFTRTSLSAKPYYNKSATVKLELPSNDTEILLKESLTLTAQIFRNHRPLIKAGVLMQNLQSTSQLQQHCLLRINEEKSRKREQLLKTIDQLNQRYGDGTINWAVCGISQSWEMRREKLSRASTTRITEIPIAIA